MTTATDVSCNVEYLSQNLSRLPKRLQEAGNSLTLAFSQNPKRFSEKQAAFVESLVKQLKNPPTKKGVGSVKKIVELFDNAKKKSKGRSPKLHLKLEDQPLVLSLAGPGASYPGTINVTDNKPYGSSKFFGRITLEGEFEQKIDYPELVNFLRDFADNPLKIAKEYGKDTGYCCCCGLELTNPVSVKEGIGPICRKKFGM